MVSGHYSEWRQTQSIVPLEHQDQQNWDTEVAMGEGMK